MNYASIDIGTNTVLLLVARCRNGTVEVLHEEQRTPRLGRRVDNSGKLNPGSMERVLNALDEYRNLLKERYPKILAEDVIVIATSAVRDAANREAFIHQIRQETGFKVRLLDGEEEADYTYAGALCMLPELGQAAVIDIGGWSTEIALGEGMELVDRHSFDMGSVRFTERYLEHDPPLPDEIEACADAVPTTLETRPFLFDSMDNRPRLVGVAGTVTSLAFMEYDFVTYDPERLNGSVLTRAAVKNWIGKLSGMSAGAIERAYPVVMEGRADVITAGLLILHGIMEFYSMAEVIVSTGGIRHGAILKKETGEL